MNLLTEIEDGNTCESVKADVAFLQWNARDDSGYGRWDDYTAYIKMSNNSVDDS